MSSIFHSTWKTQKVERIGALEGVPFRIFFNPLLQNIKQLKGTRWGFFCEKNLTMLKKLKEGPFEEKKIEKSLTASKKMEDGTL